MKKQHNNTDPVANRTVAMSNTRSNKWLSEKNSQSRQKYPQKQGKQGNKPKSRASTNKDPLREGNASGRTIRQLRSIVPQLQSTGPMLCMKRAIGRLVCVDFVFRRVRLRPLRSVKWVAAHAASSKEKRQRMIEE